MTGEHAGIYYHPAAEEQYFKMSDASQARLSAFLETKRAALEASGGGNQEGFKAEWEPGRVVYWDIKLRPRPHERGAEPDPAPAPKRRSLGTYYRIEVLEIHKSAFR
jgi:hypothetical protein